MRETIESYDICQLGISYETGIGKDVDTSEAVRLYRLAAMKNVPEAHYRLGLCYNNGIGVVKNTEEALKEFEIAAELGCKSACYQLGLQYLLVKDYRKAYSNFYNASKSGNADAIYYVGYCIENEFGNYQKPETASLWYKEAGEKGHTGALIALAEFYYNGINVPKDLNIVRDALKRAIELGDYNAETFYNEVFNEEFSTEKNETIEEDTPDNVEKEDIDLDNIEENKDEDREDLIVEEGEDSEQPEFVTELLEKVKESDSDAMVKLAIYYFEQCQNQEALQLLKSSSALGNSDALTLAAIFYDKCGQIELAVQKLQKASSMGNLYAFEWLRKKSEIGCKEAIFEMAECYGKGIIVPKQPDKAFELYCKSADLCFGDAMFKKAYCLEKGIGVDVDIKAALIEYVKVANFGHVGAQYRLSLLSFKMHNDSKFLSYLIQAAKGKHTAAQYVLAQVYLNILPGYKGTALNPSKAVSLLKESASMNNTRAMMLLSRCYSKGIGIERSIKQSTFWHSKAIDSGYDSNKPIEFRR